MSPHCEELVLAWEVLFQRAVQYQVCGYDWEVRRAFGCHSHHDQVSRLNVNQPFNCQFRPFKAPPQKNVRGRVKFQDWRVRLSTYAGGPKSCKWSGSWLMVSSNSWARLSTSRHPTTNPCGCPATGTFIVYHWRLQTSPTKTSRVGPGSWRLEGVREENLFAT